MTLEVDKDLIHYCKRLPQALWFQMDIVPLIVDVQRTGPIEERADSASRKCAMRFGIDGLPRVNQKITSLWHRN